MPRINCAASFGNALTSAVVREQELKLASSLAGETIVRDGQVMTVESVKLADRLATLVDMQGARQTLGFDNLFSERVDIIKPDVLLQPLKTEDVVPSWVGRSIYKNGERWKIVKINRPPDLVQPLITIESDTGAFQIHNASELASQGWQIRRRATPTVSQRLAGVFRNVEEQLEAGRTWTPEPIVEDLFDETREAALKAWETRKRKAQELAAAKSAAMPAHPYGEREPGTPEHDEVVTSFIDETHYSHNAAANIAKSMVKDPEVVAMTLKYRIVPGGGTGTISPDVWATMSEEQRNKQILAWTEKAVSKSVDSWAGTSADSYPQSVALQLAAQREFGLKDAKIEHFDPSTMKHAIELDSKAGAFHQKMLRHMYNLTQADFAAKGIKTLNLNRGMGFNAEHKFRSDEKSWAELIPTKGMSTSANFTSQPLSSFSSNYLLAKSWSDSNYRYGYLLSTKVPAAQVLSTTRTGLGTQGENEVVLLGLQGPMRIENRGMTYKPTTEAKIDNVPYNIDLYLQNADWLKPQGQTVTETREGALKAWDTRGRKGDDYPEDLQMAITAWSNEPIGASDIREGITKILQGKKITSEQRLYSEAILGGLKLSKPAPKLYRGINVPLTSKTVDDVVHEWKSKIGKTVDIPLSSFTSSKLVATDFSTQFDTAGGVPVRFEMDAGGKALSIEKYSRLPFENEWITGGRFKVTSVDVQPQRLKTAVIVGLTQKSLFSAKQQSESQILEPGEFNLDPEIDAYFDQPFSDMREKAQTEDSAASYKAWDARGRNPESLPIRDQRPTLDDAKAKLSKIKLNHTANAGEGQEGRKLDVASSEIRTLRNHEQFQKDYASNKPSGFIRLHYGVFEKGKFVGTIHKNSAGRVEFNEFTSLGSWKVDPALHTEDQNEFIETHEGALKAWQTRKRNAEDKAKTQASPASEPKNDLVMTESGEMAYRSPVEAMNALTATLPYSKNLYVASNQNALKAAYRLNQQLQTMKHEGYKLPDTVSVDLETHTGKPHAETIKYDDMDHTIALNIYVPSSLPSEYTLDEAVQAVYQAHPGSFVEKNFKDVIVHEMAHVQHGAETYPHLGPLKPIAALVSGYSQRNRAEFMAEAFTQMYRGESIHPSAMNLYKSYGGPEVKH